MNQFKLWLIRSSKDPKNYALYARGLVVLAGGYLVKLLDAVCAFGFTCIGVDATLINRIAEGVDAFVYGSLILLGAAMTIWGLIRKWINGRWAAPLP